MALRLKNERELAQYLGAKPAAKPAARPPARQRPRPVASAEPSAVRSITFEFPLPPTGCSPNNSGGSSHWRAKEGPRADYKKECCALLAGITGVMFTRACIRAEFFHGAAPGRYHARDEQNAIAGIKGLCDSLVDRGYLPDDSARHLHWGEVTIHLAKESGARAAVVVTLERM